MRRSPGRRLSTTTHLRIHPELRNDVLERSDCDGLMTVYGSLAADFDAAASGDAARHRGVLGILRCVFLERPQVVEVPEPLWTKHWPKQVFLLSTLRLVRAVPLSPRPLLLSYAIENAPPAERLSLPYLDSHPRAQRAWIRLSTTAWAVSIPLLDLMVFGTPAAAENYDEHFKSSMLRVRRVLIPDSLAVCSKCELPPFTSRPPLALFVGELSARKGVDVLLNAWRAASEAKALPANARLVIVGDGPQAADLRGVASDLDGVEVLGALGRAAVHDLLRLARVVVLPSRRVRRWREQIGISLLEGEAHLCNLITSSESGLALALHSRSGARVVSPGDVSGLASSIVTSLYVQMRLPRPEDGRAALERYVHQQCFTTSASWKAT